MVALRPAKKGDHWGRPYGYLPTMSDFLAAYQISRTRFEDEVKGLTQQQLNWRMQPDSMTIGEAAMHVAGAEVNFISGLKAPSN